MAVQCVRCATATLEVPGHTARRQDMHLRMPRTAFSTHESLVQNLAATLLRHMYADSGMLVRGQRVHFTLLNSKLAKTVSARNPHWCREGQLISCSMCTRVPPHNLNR